MVQVTPLASVMLLVAFIVFSISEDGGDAAKDSVHNPNADQDSGEEQPCNGCGSEKFHRG